MNKFCRIHFVTEFISTNFMWLLILLIMALLSLNGFFHFKFIDSLFKDLFILNNFNINYYKDN